MSEINSFFTTRRFSTNKDARLNLAGRLCRSPEVFQIYSGLGFISASWKEGKPNLQICKQFRLFFPPSHINMYHYEKVMAPLQEPNYHLSRNGTFSQTSSLSEMAGVNQLPGAH